MTQVHAGIGGLAGQGAASRPQPPPVMSVAPQWMQISSYVEASIEMRVS